MVAATAVSPSLATGELEAARAFAAGLGVDHLTPATHELDREGYVANAGDRCYFCKSELVEVLDGLSGLGPLTAGGTVLTGTNADDARAGFRPGIRAADERGARAPLRDAGLTKAQVREASRRWGLVTWDKPAAACLSSRVAYGVPVTRERLERVDRAELAVRAELVAADAAPADLGSATSVTAAPGSRSAGPVWTRCSTTPDGRPPWASGCWAPVRSCGFGAAEIDPRGFRSGSMNELLPQPELFR